LPDGAIVDVGGGTTGIAIVRDGRVVYTADEPTGGTHFSLVVADSQNLSFEEAQALKTRPEEQARLLPSLRPVMEKVASIILRHVEGRSVPLIVLVGGTSAFPNMAEVVEDHTHIPIWVPPNSVFVTPLGIALHDKLQ
jgi:ethanolamine utilization protein EutJ